MSKVTKKLEVYMGIMVFLICLLTIGSLYNYQETRTFQKEKENIFLSASSTKGEIRDYQLPTLEELPFIVEECVEIFKGEQVLTSSYNLQYIGEEQADSLYPKYAVMGFRVLGSWEGIKKALQEIESIPQQIIHVQEMRLYEGGGEFIFWIHFLEPQD